MGGVLVEVLVQTAVVALSVELYKVLSVQPAVCLASHVDSDFLASSEQLEVLRVHACQAQTIQVAMAQTVQAGIDHLQFIVGFGVINPFIAIGCG